MANEELRANFDDIRADTIDFRPQAAALTDPDLRAIYVRNDNLYYWNGTSETNLGSGGGGGATTWEDLFADDQTFNIASDGFTITGAAGVGSSDVVTFAANGAVSGDVIQIANSGSGSDIKGTSDTWSVSKTGVAVFSKVDLGDDQVIEFGNSNDATIQWVGSGNVLDIAGATNFDGNMTIEAAHTLTIAGAGGSTVFTITAGDLVFSDGSIALTDADNAETLTVINNTATTIGAAATAAIVQVESTSLTTGAAVNVQLTEGTLNGGFYYSGWDATAGARVFSVGEDGAVVIAGAEGSNMLTVTAGDLFLSDTNGSVMESENGTTTLLTLDNKAGAIADNAAVLLVDAGGAVASGGNALRVAFTGTASAGAILAEFLPVAGTQGVKIDAGGIATAEALYVDADSTSVSTVFFNSDGAKAADKAVLEVIGNGVSNADSAVARFEQTNTGGVSTVLALKQDDVDIPFITFETTIGGGNAIEEVGGKTLTTTHFVMVDIEGVGTRYLQVGTIA